MTTFLNLFLAGGSTFFSAIYGSFFWKSRFQKDDKFLSTDKRNQIESKIQELAQKLGISKPIELIERKGMTAQAQGIAFFSGRAGIAINPYIADAMSEAELEFVLAHELSHIKANDVFVWTGTIPSIVGVITTLADHLISFYGSFFVNRSNTYTSFSCSISWPISFSSCHRLFF